MMIKRIVMGICLSMVWTYVAVSAPTITCRVDTDRTVLPAGQEEKAVVKITVDAAEAPPLTKRTPVNVSLVLDRSSSMGGQKIEQARLAALEAVRRLHPDDVVSVVTYDSVVETMVPAQPAARNKDWIEEQIQRINPRGSTALFGGVSQGAAELRKYIESSYNHRMILLSDGIANVGPSSPAELARLGASLLKEQIHVSTVGIGLGYNEDLMTDLAREGGGNTHFVEDAGDLARIISSELGEAHQVVARRVVVEVELPDGIEPVRIIGRTGQITKNKIEIPLHQLQGGQSRYALVEVTVPPQSAEQKIEVARARVSYDDLLEQAPRQSEIIVAEVEFSVQREVVESSVVPDVQKEIAINVLAEAKDEAVRLADEGRRQEASQVLRDAAVGAQRVGGQHNFDDLLMEADVAVEQAETVREQGLDSRSRKSLRASSYQKIMQQKEVE